MNEGAVHLFLQALSIPVNKIGVRKEWASAPCPLAPFLHSGGTDSHPSFGISISPEGRSVWYCFSCAEEAKTLDWLLHTIWIASGEYPWEAAHLFASMENHSETVITAEFEDIWKLESQFVKPLPADMVNRFPKLQFDFREEAERCKRWLAIRGVPRYVQNYFQVRSNPRNGALIFPMTDSTRNVFMLKARKPYSKQIWMLDQEYLKWEDNESRFPSPGLVGAWFGMHLVDWTLPVMLVEGEIDAMRLGAFSIWNVIASSTSSVTTAQIDALCGEVYILGYDNDEAGRKANRKIAKRLKDKATLYEIDWYPFKDPGEIPSTKVFDEIFKNQIRLLMV